MLTCSYSLGRWNGFAYAPQLYPTRSMLSLHFHLSHADNEDFTAAGVEFDDDPFTVTGRVGSEAHSRLEVEWTVKYPGSYEVYYFGHLTDEFTIMGSCGVSVYDLDWQFVLKKIPAEYMTYRPSPYTLGYSSPEQSPYAYSRGMGTKGDSIAHSISDADVEHTSVKAGETDAAALADARSIDDRMPIDVDFTENTASGLDGLANGVSVRADAAASADGQSIPDVGADVPTNRLGAPHPKYRALWKYAISTILHDVRGKWWTWSYFAARRNARRNFLDAHYVGLNGLLLHASPDHIFRASQVRLACTAADAQFYESLVVFMSNTRPFSQ